MRSSDWSSDVCSSDLLYLNTERGVIFGVCAGLADYFGISRFFVRIVAVIAIFMFPPPTLFCYFMAAFLIPRAPTYHYESDAEKDFWRQIRLKPSASLSRLLHRYREREPQSEERRLGKECVDTGRTRWAPD